MATPRLDMYAIKEVLRLKAAGRTHREIAVAVGKSVGVVGKIASRARTAGLSYTSAEAMSESELRARLYGQPCETSGGSKAEPDCAWIHRERRKPGVTLELLHLEYLQAHPGGYQYTAFCERYRTWLKRRGLSMRQVHRAGEKAFVDYAGKKPWVIDPRTGEARQVELFVGVLGASSKPAEAANRLFWAASEASQRRKLPTDFFGPQAKQASGGSCQPTFLGRDATEHNVGR